MFLILLMIQKKSCNYIHQLDETLFEWLFSIEEYQSNNVIKKKFDVNFFLIFSLKAFQIPKYVSLKKILN